MSFNQEAVNHTICGQNSVPKMDCPGKLKQGLMKTFGPWWFNGDPYPFWCNFTNRFLDDQTRGRFQRVWFARDHCSTNLCGLEQPCWLLTWNPK